MLLHRTFVGTILLSITQTQHCHYTSCITRYLCAPRYHTAVRQMHNDTTQSHIWMLSESVSRWNDARQRNASYPGILTVSPLKIGYAPLNGLPTPKPALCPMFKRFGVDVGKMFRVREIGEADAIWMRAKEAATKAAIGSMFPRMVIDFCAHHHSAGENGVER